MRLAAKLVLLFLVGMLLIVALFSYLTIQLDHRLAISEHQRHAAELVDAVKQSIPSPEGTIPASDLRNQLGWSVMQIRESRIRLVDVTNGDELYRPSVPAELIITNREITTVSRPDETGRNRFYTYIPLQDGSTNQGRTESLEISSPDPGADDRFRRSLISSLIALLGVTTLSGLVIVVGGVKMVGKPLNALIEKVHRVGQGDFSKPVQVRSGDELGRLGKAINQMCEQLDHQRYKLKAETASRIEAVEQLRHAERLNMVGRMAAGIAHEIGTPLNVVSGRAELIASGMLSEDAIKESAKTIQSESQRITTIVRHLLDFARESTPKRSQQDLNQLISLTASLMEPLAAKHQTRLVLRLPDPPLHANIDPGQIQQVLTNLIVNAIQTIQDAGEVIVSLDQADSQASSDPDTETNRFCRIAITDNGPGIAQQDLEHIFEPFFTTKDIGEGTGLGLSISHGIVQEHQGWIKVESEEEQGSTFSIYLPMDAIHQGPEGTSCE